MADNSSVEPTPPENDTVADIPNDGLKVSARDFIPAGEIETRTETGAGSKVSSKDLIPPKDVANVHPETKIERISRQVTRFWGDFVRIAVASLISLIGFGFLLYVFLSDNPKFEKFRDQAWPVVLTMIGGAGGYMFAKKD